MKYVEYRVTFAEIPDEISLCINISGCENSCIGCHSPWLQKDIGIELTIEELQTLILNNKGITCVCFMGHGNITNIQEAIYLASDIKSKGLKTAIYSGYSLLHIPNINVFDFIKEGKYVKDKGPLNNFKTNQRFYKNINGNFEDYTDLFWKDWKYIIRGKYAVSRDGQVYSFITNKLIKPFYNQKGYLKVKLYFNNTNKTYFIHRLVAKAFLPNFSDNLQINHKDENKENNCVDNLELCDSTYNNNYGHRTEKSIKSRITSNSYKKVYQYSLTGDLLNVYNSAASAGRSINKNADLIRHCCEGGVYMKDRNKFVPIQQAYGFIWKYEHSL